MTKESDDGQQPSRRRGLDLGALLGMALFHLTAIAVLFGLTLWPFMHGRIAGFVESMGRPEFFYATLPQIGIHLLVAALIWAILYGLWWMRPRKGGAMRAMKAARGTVITETIIIMPILLLLILGMAQMAINSAAGMLANLAAYEAARAVWVWHPEQSRFNGGGDYGGATVVNENYVAEMGRIQAAAVMTPVAHSFGTSTGSFPASAGAPPRPSAHASEEFRQMRGALVGAQIDRPGDRGQEGRTRADVLSENVGGGGGYGFFGGTEGEHGYSFVMALDSSRYPVRSAWKFSGAYLSTNVEFNAGGTDENGHPTIQTTLTYDHFLSMPLIGAMPMFGTILGTKLEGGQAPGGRVGYYARFVRTFTYIQQPNSHPGAP